MARLVEQVKRTLYHECEHQVCTIWRSPSEHTEQWYMETGGYEPCTEEIAYCPYCGAYLRGAPATRTEGKRRSSGPWWSRRC